MSSYELVDPTLYQPLFVIPEAGESSPVPPRHESPTDEFMAALYNPQYVGYGGISHAVYVFNEDRGVESTPPLVFVPPVDQYNGAASRSGVQLLNGLATHLDRQIISIDLPATGSSDRPKPSYYVQASLDATAEMINYAVDSVGFKGENVDFMGICIGGAIAARAAVCRGGQTRSLLTFSTPGFEADLHHRLSEQIRRNTPESQADRRCDELADSQAALYDNLGADYLDIRSLPSIDVHKILRKFVHLKLGYELVGKHAAMLTLPEDLPPQTQWHDFVGDKDILTSWQNHVRATGHRNPATTRQTVLQEVGHDWPMIRAPYAARLAELALAGM